PRAPQIAGLPNGKYRSAERLLVCGRFLGGQRHPVAIIEQFGDVPLAIAYALALDLGWMGGKDRANKRSVKKRLELRRCYTCVQRTPKRACYTTIALGHGHFVRSMMPN